MTASPQGITDGPGSDKGDGTRERCSDETTVTANSCVAALGSTAVLLGALVGTSQAQLGRETDVRIDAMELASQRSHITVRVVVATDDGGPANVAIHLFLPAGSRVERVAPGCRPSPGSTADASARVDCNLGAMRVRDLREVTVVTAALRPGAGRRFAAFAYGDTPDPNLANNLAERVLP